VHRETKRPALCANFRPDKCVFAAKLEHVPAIRPGCGMISKFSGPFHKFPINARKYSSLSTAFIMLCLALIFKWFFFT
jgi:hypothetical protein